MGGYEADTLVFVEPTLKYHPGHIAVLTVIRMNLRTGQFQLGSLTGAVSSKKVTEECKGTLSLVGNQASSARVKGCLTARPISRADAKAGPSDPVIPYGRVIAHQIKGTLGITG